MKAKTTWYMIRTAAHSIGFAVSGSLCARHCQGQVLATNLVGETLNCGILVKGVNGGCYCLFIYALAVVCIKWVFWLIPAAGSETYDSGESNAVLLGGEAAIIAGLLTAAACLPKAQHAFAVLLVLLAAIISFAGTFMIIHCEKGMPRHRRSTLIRHPLLEWAWSAGTYLAAVAICSLALGIPNLIATWVGLLLKWEFGGGS